jgi:transketolase
MGELTVVVDHNKIQSDTWLRRVSDLGNLEEKFRSFGWHAVRCDGHDHAALAQTFAGLRGVSDRPQVIIADTIKGRGVSFMEAFGPDDKFYGFHSGAPTDEQYSQALDELTATAERLVQKVALGKLALASYDHVVAPPSPAARHKLVEAYERQLVVEAAKNPKLVVLDADLIKDCGLTQFQERFPERLIECGIAEQDMVSQAGGLALKGMLPVAHSFSCFLSARPNEQIYTNATEGSKIIYVATLAGLLPATPGHSHQSVRDVSSLAAVPGLIVLAPATEAETETALAWATHTSPESTYLRLSSIPCVVPFPGHALPKTPGRGTILREGADVVIFAYGPVMTSQAYLAAVELEETQGVSLKVVNFPWLNRVDKAWLLGAVRGVRWLFCVDDHYLHGGLGDALLSALAEVGWPAGLRAKKLGLDTPPACGQNDEVLRHHGLDAHGIAASVCACLQRESRQ